MDKLCMRFDQINRILVLVPHQDDEIAVAGSLIWTLRQQNKEVYVCYATNGDYEISADIRYQEACEALEVLGVSKDYIIMLGYPDTSNEDGLAHIFYHEGTNPIHSKGGYDHTYSGELFTDYATLVYGQQHSYTRQNYLNDVKAVMHQLLPDLIICVDMDHHVDHRMLSLIFERAMGEILKENPNYRPKVWKAFAYGTNYAQVRDYWQINLNKTQYPQTRLRDNEGKMDNPFYDWRKRVRVPVDPKLYTLPIKYGIIYRALEKYASQMAILFAESTINSDQVFWERRTDNLLLQADVSASSGNAKFLNDFMLFDASSIHEVEHYDREGLWIPDEEDNQKCIFIDLRESQVLDSISIWGLGQDIELQIMNKNQYITKSCKHLTGEWHIDLPDHFTAQTLKLIFKYDKRVPFGIGEIELLKEQEGKLRYIKLLVNDLFVNTYYTCFSIPKVKLYQYNINIPNDQIVYYVNGKPIKSLKRWRFLFKKNVKINVVVKNNSHMSDEVELHFVKPIHWFKRKKELAVMSKQFEEVKKETLSRR